jgi:integrase
MLWTSRGRSRDEAQATDLDPAAGLVRVRNGKGGKPRTVGLDPEAFGVIESWLEQRQKLRLSGHQPPLCTLDGQPLDSGYCRAMLKRLSNRAGIKHRVHLHGLRHTHAVELVRPKTAERLGRAAHEYEWMVNWRHELEGDLKRPNRHPRSILRLVADAIDDILANRPVSERDQVAAQQ